MTTRRKRSRDSAVAEEQDGELIRHIHSLGLTTVEQYRHWCEEDGFGRGLSKNWKVRARERFYADGKTLARLILHVQDHTNLLTSHPVIEQFGRRAGKTYAEALTYVAAHSGWRLRSIEDWKPRTHNARRQFASLLHHLFAQYDMRVRCLLLRWLRKDPRPVVFFRLGTDEQT